MTSGFTVPTAVQPAPGSTSPPQEVAHHPQPPQGETHTMTTTCAHPKQMEHLVAMSNSALRHRNSAGVHAAAQLGNETMAECRATCGDQSPYRNIQPSTGPHQDLQLAGTYATSGPGILVEALTEGVRDLVQRFRRR
jgi:hypothetical protein